VFRISLVRVRYRSCFLFWEAHVSQWSIASEVSGIIASDGPRIGKRDMLNTVLVTHHEVFFLQRTDVTGKSKGSDFLSPDLLAILKDIGSNKVGLITMDGAAPSLTCMKTIEAKFPLILIQCCSTYAYSLIDKGLFGNKRRIGGSGRRQVP